MKKKILSLVLATVLASSLLVACGDSGTSPDAPAASTPNAETPDATSADASLNELNVCLASEPATLDPALNTAVDGGTLAVHLFSGLAKWELDEAGNVVLVADEATELPEGVTNEDGTVTYTYTLRDGLQWSDGQPVTAHDYVFAWNRAVSPELAADYGYMFEVIDGYAEASVSSDAKLNVEAPDDKTLVVTLSNAISYWDQLLAFPTYLPVREDVVANENWATDPSTYVGNGAYKMTDWTHNSVITLTKSETYVDKDSVTMPVINFYLSDDQNNMLTNFKNGDWQMIDEVPTNEIAAISAEYPDEYYVTGQLGTYFVCWTVDTELLPASSTLTGADAENARAEIRKAVGLLLDRNYIVNDISQGGQVPASSYVAMGLTDADGSEFYQNAGSNSFTGYYDVSEDALGSNYEQALEVLKKYYTFDEASQQFTDFPTLTYLYNTGEGHKAIGEYIQNALAGVGITLNLENQEWGTFIPTRKDGDYQLARHGWLGDYNDPISFIDMWTSGSGNNDVQFGRGNHASIKAYSIDLTDLGIDVKVENGTWAETYDVLVSEIKKCTDETVRFELMHRAEDLFMSTGAITPLYYYTDIYMVDDAVKGFYTTPLGFKYFMNCHY